MNEKTLEYLNKKVERAMALKQRIYEMSKAVDSLKDRQQGYGQTPMQYAEINGYWKTIRLENAASRALLLEAVERELKDLKDEFDVL